MKTISVFCCLLYAAGTEGAGIKVEGIEGGELSFQCSHKYAWNNHKYLCKDPCKDVLAKAQNGGRAASGRITLVDSENGVFIVTFSPLQLSDMGRYWCAVERFGFDTFTEVQITVKKAVAIEYTTAIPTTWTHPTIKTSAELTPGTSMPTNLLTASNNTNGGKQISSTGTALYATVGAVAMLTILTLAIIVGKRRVKLKPQPEVCSNSTDLFRADEREAACVYDNIGEDVQSMKKISELFSCSDHKNKLDPPTAASTAVECSVPLHIYENICRSKGSKHPRHSAAKVQDKREKSSGIYIKRTSKRSGEGRLGKHTNTPTATKNAKSKPTCSDYTEVRPRSLWFGLDISGTV